MSDTAHRESPPGTKRHYSRPDLDMTDAEIDAWAEHFCRGRLGRCHRRRLDQDLG